jgi:ribose-phosphate pyrophosphokinase
MRLNEVVKIGITNLSAVPLIAKYLVEKGFKKAYCLSPDEGAIHLAEAAAEILGGGYGFFEKVRDLKTGDIQMTVKNLDVKGMDAIVIDDIISSGGTMASAISGLKSQGAARVAATCIHGLFIGNSVKKIVESGADLLVSTDTVESDYSKVSIAPLIGEYLKEYIQ